MKRNFQAQATAAKRQHILDAAATVFAGKGFHAATIGDVAAAAGVAHGSIYTYFENKEALLLGLFDLMTAQVEAGPAAPPESGPRALLQAAFHQPLAALTGGNAELFRVIVSEALVNRAFAQRLRTQILEPMILTATGLLQRTLFPGVPVPPDLELRVRVVSGLVLGTIVQCVLHDDVLEARWDELPGLLADVVLHGLQGSAT